MSIASVSVLMAVHNGQPHLRAAVESMLAQSLEDFEFIIIDDGSTDGSTEYLASLRDSRIRVVRQDRQGLGASLNRALSLVRTPFVARMDADDVSVPSRLETQLRFAQSHPKVGFFGSGFAFTVDGNTSGYGPAMPLTHEQIVATLARGGHAICHPTLFCSTELIRSVGAYRITGVGQDWDLFMRMAEVAGAANVPEVLLLYRLHPSSNAWSSAYRTIVAKRYALHCAACRRNGTPWPEPEDYFAEWARKSMLRRLRVRAEAASEVLYRRAIVELLEGRRCRAVGSLALASVANPSKLVLRTRRELHGLMRAPRHAD